ncbi:MAG: DUF2703 domain-containing protein [Candidatus Krumholzibacteriia bacterium]
MKVQILYFDGCPNFEPTLDLLKQTASKLSVHPQIDTVEVKSANDARRLRFLGSPTVRVDGQDVDPAARCRTDYAMSCRVYGSSHTPPRELLEAALLGGNGSCK